VTNGNQREYHSVQNSQLYTLYKLMSSLFKLILTLKLPWCLLLGSFSSMSETNIESE